MSNTCEHGHLARKCEVCELKAEVARLRSVCRLASDYACEIRSRTLSRTGTWMMLNNLMKDLADAGKEATDGL